MNKIMERNIEIVLEAIEDVIIKDGNESCTIVWETINKFIDSTNYLELFSYNIDYVIDACRQ